MLHVKWFLQNLILELIWTRSDPVNTCLVQQGPEEHPVDEQIRRLWLWSCVMVLHKDDVKLTTGAEKFKESSAV